LNFLDRCIAAVSPGAGLRRLAARSGIQAFEAAEITRTHKAKRQTRSADNSLQRDAESLRGQARKLDEDHDLVTGIFDRLEERVVGGAGIAVEPLPLDHAGSIHLAFAAQIKDLWAEWSLRPETSGELTRAQMERLVCRTWLRDGEALAQQLLGKVANFKHLHKVPFTLELLEPDYLPWNYNDDSKGICQGITRDAWRRVLGYNLLKRHPGSALGFSLSSDTKFVPADRMLHIAYRKRIGQNRGQPLLHAVLTRLADIKDYEESERVAARISAALAMFIKKGSTDDYVVTPTTAGKDGQATGARSIPIAPGMVFDGLLPGEDVGMIESNRPSQFVESFRNGQLRAVAAGTRIGYSTATRSYTGTYSAQRQELVESQLGYDLLQHEFIDYWSRKVYRAFVEMALVSGVLVPPGDVNMDSVYSAVYQGPVMPWINPVHEANAWDALVQGGFADEAEVARARGRNPQELKRSREAEVKSNRAKGLVFSSDAYHKFYGKVTVNADLSNEKEKA